MLTVEKAPYWNSLMKQYPIAIPVSYEASEQAVCGKDLLNKAAGAIRSKNFSTARVLLKQFMSTDMENPGAYNLLGISYELEGDRLKVEKVYRVAYYMNQTFQAPSDNLSRVCDFYYKGIRISVGDLNFQEVEI